MIHYQLVHALSEITRLASQNGHQVILPSLPSEDSNDLDLLITDRKKSSLRFLYDLNLVIQKGHRAPSYAFVLSKDRKIWPIDLTGTGWLLDTTLEALTHYTQFGPGGTLMLTSRPAHALKLVKELRTPGRYRPSTLQHLHGALQEDEAKIRYYVSLICKLQNYRIQPFLDVIDSLYYHVPTKNEWHRLRLHAFPNLKTKSPASLPAKAIKKITNIGGHWAPHRSERPMPLIAFVGIDGSGKSSAIDRFIHRNPKVKTKVMTLRGQNPGFALTRHLQSTLTFVQRGANQLRIKPVSFLCRNLKTSVDYTDRLLRALLAKHSPHNTGTVILSDRWSYDAVVNVAVRGRNTLLLNLFYIKLMPRPDLVIFFDIDGSTSYRRVQEYSRDMQDSKAHFLRHLVATEIPPERTVTISGDETIDNIDAAIDTAFMRAAAAGQKIAYE